jgi:transposase
MKNPLTAMINKLGVDAHGMPVRVLITKGTRADCKEAIHLIEGITAEALPADRGYDTNEIIAYAASAGMEVVIPPKKNRKEKRAYDEYLYRIRHLVENAFLVLKRWRGIATRYAKTSDGFIAAVLVRCIAIWASILA